MNYKELKERLKETAKQKEDRDYLKYKLKTPEWVDGISDEKPPEPKYCMDCGKEMDAYSTGRCGKCIKAEKEFIRKLRFKGSDKHCQTCYRHIKSCICPENKAIDKLSK